MALVAVVAAGCEDGSPPSLPDDAELRGLYGPRAELRLNGNVVDVTVVQDGSDLARGGELWARVGPYIFLFSPQTREVFERHRGVAAVRVRTVTRAETWVARAMLERDTLTSVGWQEAIRRVSAARREGTRNPRHLERLVRFGEDHARYEYNPRYVTGR